MRILIVANHNKGKYSTFVTEQVESTKKFGVVAEYFGVHGKGVSGYLSNLPALRAKIKEFHPDLIHAHYGLCGLLANLQRMVPVVTTYHGSDIHSKGKNLFYSSVSIRLSALNIFVSNRLLIQSGYHGKKKCVIPCGVDTKIFYPIAQEEARKQLGWELDKKYVLFAGAFDNEVKNSGLAKAATALVDGAELMELRGYTRDQVCLAMNAANCLLLTSHREGCPLVVKEAMACGTPVVSVDVGDVISITKGAEGCYIASRDAHDVAECLQKALAFQGKTDGMQQIFIKKFNKEQIAEQVVEAYQKLLK